MFTITFNPGPSQISQETKNDIREAIENRIIEISHRSKEFDAISQSAIKNLRQFFKIPEDYYVFYTASATEAMELTLRHCVQQKSFHFTNGNFSEYFAQIAQALGKQTTADAAEWGTLNDFAQAQIPDDAELITITANETSTGVMCSDSDIKKIRQRYPNHLLAVDITSNGGVVEYAIKNADIWLFSVQKCLGLPAGLGILIMSPRAYERAQYYTGIFSVQNMQKKMAECFETIQTPNVLNIYLLQKQLERWNKTGGLAAKEKETQAKAKKVYDFFKTPFVQNPAHRSITVMTIAGQPVEIEKLHAACKKNSIILGKGYGKIKETTFRISNFPAITKDDFETLFRVVSTS